MDPWRAGRCNLSKRIASSGDLCVCWKLKPIPRRSNPAPRRCADASPARSPAQSRRPPRARQPTPRFPLWTPGDRLAARACCQAAGSSRLSTAFTIPCSVGSIAIAPPQDSISSPTPPRTDTRTGLPEDSHSSRHVWSRLIPKRRHDTDIAVVEEGGLGRSRDAPEKADGTSVGSSLHLRLQTAAAGEREGASTPRELGRRLEENMDAFHALERPDVANGVELLTRLGGSGRHDGRGVPDHMLSRTWEDVSLAVEHIPGNTDDVGDGCPVAAEPPRAKAAEEAGVARTAVASRQRDSRTEEVVVVKRVHHRNAQTPAVLPYPVANPDRLWVWMTSGRCRAMKSRTVRRNGTITASTWLRRRLTSLERQCFECTTTRSPSNPDGPASGKACRKLTSWPRPVSSRARSATCFSVPPTAGSP